MPRANADKSLSPAVRPAFVAGQGNCSSAFRGCPVNEVLARLEKIYRQQLEIYDQVLELAEQA